MSWTNRIVVTAGFVFLAAAVMAIRAQESHVKFEVTSVKANKN